MILVSSGDGGGMVVRWLQWRATAAPWRWRWCAAGGGYDGDVVEMEMVTSAVVMMLVSGGDRGGVVVRWLQWRATAAPWRWRWCAAGGGRDGDGLEMEMVTSVVWRWG
ncbi:hypothetical protein Tco_1172802 [Tanacetum coccineum]